MLGRELPHLLAFVDVGAMRERNEEVVLAVVEVIPASVEVDSCASKKGLLF